MLNELLYRAICQNTRSQNMIQYQPFIPVCKIVIVFQYARPAQLCQRSKKNPFPLQHLQSCNNQHSYLTPGNALSQYRICQPPFTLSEGVLGRGKNRYVRCRFPVIPVQVLVYQVSRES